MLSVYAAGADGKRFLMSPPESMLICMDEGVPADSLSAVFPEVIGEELAWVYVYDGDSEIFRGIVDEQTVYAGDGVKTEIICRSMAALLVDNEACPATFANFSSELLFRYYLKPLGFSSYTGGGTVSSVFTVEKGSSCFEVAEKFARLSGTKMPRVSGDIIHFDAVTQVPCAVFENRVDSEYCFTALEYSRLRCKLISRTCTKIKPLGEYSVVTDNPSAQNRGVVRERYINSVYEPESYLTRTRNLFSAGERDSCSVVLWCNSRYTGLLGTDVTVRGVQGETLTGFYVSSLRYSLSENGEQTKLTLKKKEN